MTDALGFRHLYHAQGAGSADMAPATAWVHVSPRRRAWRRFRRNKLGFWSLVVFVTLVVLSLFAEVLSNDKPLVVRYDGNFYFPLVQSYPETTFGGDFLTETDYLDPFIKEQLTRDGNPAPAHRPTRARPSCTTVTASRPSAR